MSKGMMETLLASQSSEALGAQRVKGWFWTLVYGQDPFGG